MNGRQHLLHMTVPPLPPTFTLSTFHEIRTGADAKERWPPLFSGLKYQQEQMLILVLLFTATIIGFSDEINHKVR